MNIKKVDRTWNKWFTNRAGSTPLMYGGAVKILMEVLCNELLLVSGGRVFNSFAERLELWSRKVSAVLELGDKFQGRGGDPGLLS